MLCVLTTLISFCCIAERMSSNAFCSTVCTGCGIKTEDEIEGAWDCAPDEHDDDDDEEVDVRVD